MLCLVTNGEAHGGAEAYLCGSVPVQKSLSKPPSGGDVARAGPRGPVTKGPVSDTPGGVTVRPTEARHAALRAEALGIQGSLRPRTDGYLDRVSGVELPKRWHRLEKMAQHVDRRMSYIVPRLCGGKRTL